LQLRYVLRISPKGVAVTVLDKVTPLDTGVTRVPMDQTHAYRPRAATAADAAADLAPT
jgi:hypothetical protein